MGGLGSSRWHGTHTRAQADASFIICAPRGCLLPALLKSRAVLYGWRIYRFHVVATITGEPGADFTFHLTYTAQGIEREQAITVEATRPHYGGVRLWFHCPGCQARATKLYLPPRRSLFLCRVCHGLSYESAQMAGGLWPGVWQADARRWGVSTRVFRETFRATHGAECATVRAHTAELVIIPPDDELE